MPFVSSMPATIAACEDSPLLYLGGLLASPCEIGILKALRADAGQVREVIDTFRTAAEMGPESLSGYVISMATNPSDVLAVELLMREAAFLVSCRSASRSPLCRLLCRGPCDSCSYLQLGLPAL